MKFFDSPKLKAAVGKILLIYSGGGFFQRLFCKVEFL